jgi:hypothetical protein
MFSLSFSYRSTSTCHPEEVLELGLELVLNVRDLGVEDGEAVPAVLGLAPRPLLPLYHRRAEKRGSG